MSNVMKRLIIICEGETEQEFCKDVLYKFFQNKDIYIETPLIKKSLGGIVSWPSIKKQINAHLQENVNVYVTMLIDYYGIKGSHNFPKWEESLSIDDKFTRMNFLEFEMCEDIDESLRNRFIPYVQLHEFEGLLFNNIEVFKNNIPANEFKNIQELENTINQYPNPEIINNGAITAPSKRLERLIVGYNKIIYGSTLAVSIGLDQIRSKAVRFNHWIEILEAI